MPLRTQSRFFPVKVSDGEGFTSFFLAINKGVKNIVKKIGKTLSFLGKKVLPRLIIPVIKASARSILPAVVKGISNKLADKFKNPSIQKTIKSVGQRIGDDLSKNPPKVLLSKPAVKAPVKRVPAAAAKRAPTKVPKAPAKRRTRGGRSILPKRSVLTVESKNIINNLLSKKTGRGLLFME